MYLIIAAMLDPRFKLRWCASESEEYKTFYDALVHKATSSNASEDNPDVLQHVTQSEVSEQTQGKEEHLPPSKKKKATQSI